MIKPDENKGIELTGEHSTFFSLTFNDTDNVTDQKKIDNAKKTLDSIHHVYEEVKKQEQQQKVKSENNQNDHIVMTGTDYHGDRRSFQAGVISELVEWKKDVISVMDVTDGEILFTGSIDQIKNNLAEIKNRLREKNEKHASEIKNELRSIITNNIQKILSDFSCTFENNEITIKKNNDEKTVVIDMEELLNILTDMNKDNQQKKGLLYNLIGGKLYETFGNEDKSYTHLLNFLQQFFDISPQQKIALVHDFELNKDFDPTKKSIVLTGDYIDRGEGSCEILCMISNIQKKISTDERFKNHEDCFIATSGNHESNFLPKKIQNGSVNNYENDCYANRLAKKMMKDGKLVSGHIIKSDKDNDDTFYSFSHTFILKTDCYLIMRQIFELEELVANINKENWLNDTNNKNEFVMATKEICRGKINSYGRQILKLLADRYQTVRKSEKYKKALEKVIQNKNLINEKLKYYDKAIFEDKNILESGRQFYDDLKDIFSDEDFFQLRYLSMDALVYPIAASEKEKLDLIPQSLEDNKIKEVLKYNNLAFSDFFNRATPKCLKSILAISDKNDAPSSPNCLNWNRFFKGITKDDILQNGTQFVGHDPLKFGQFVTFHSKIVETDVKQSAGFRDKKKSNSLIDKTFININNPKESYTYKYEATNIGFEKPNVQAYSNHTDLLNNNDLKHEKVKIPHELQSPPLFPSTSKVNLNNNDNKDKDVNKLNLSSCPTSQTNFSSTWKQFKDSNIDFDTLVKKLAEENFDQNQKGQNQENAFQNFAAKYKKYADYANNNIDDLKSSAKAMIDELQNKKVINDNDVQTLKDQIDNATDVGIFGIIAQFFSNLFSKGKTAFKAISQTKQDRVISNLKPLSGMLRQTNGQNKNDREQI